MGSRFWGVGGRGEGFGEWGEGFGGVGSRRIFFFGGVEVFWLFGGLRKFWRVFVDESLLRKKNFRFIRLILSLHFIYTKPNFAMIIFFEINQK